MTPWALLQQPLNIGDTVGRARVIREPGRYVAASRLLLFGKQLLEESVHAAGTNARSHHIVESAFVSLHFVAATEFREDSCAADIDRSLRDSALANTSQRTEYPDADVGSLRLFHLLNGVPPHYVLYLVSEHAGDFRHVARPLENPAIDVDEPTGERERIDDAGIDDTKLPVQIGSRRRSGDALAERIHVVLNYGVLHHRQLGVYLLRLLLPHLHFLLSGDAAAGQQPGDGKC